jgi:DNA-directed RNA polymerase specialized sigma54-like protein
MIVRNLKKIVKEAREDNDALRAENQKIKKMMKYTKINEFEIERKMLTDENRRLGTMLEDYRSHFSDQQEMERENEELKKYLEEELEEKQQAAEEREKYEEIIDSLEEKIASENDKYQNK